LFLGDWKIPFAKPRTIGAAIRSKPRRSPQAKGLTLRRKTVSDPIASDRPLQWTGRDFPSRQADRIAPKAALR
jgi:hypothetical protein